MTKENSKPSNFGVANQRNMPLQKQRLADSRKPPSPLKSRIRSIADINRLIGVLLVFSIVFMIPGIIIICLKSASTIDAPCILQFKYTYEKSTITDSYPHTVVIADLNNDSLLDLAVANYGTNTIGVFFQQTDGSFGNQTTFSTGFESHPNSIAAGDFNNDHNLDIAVAKYGTNQIGILFGNGNGTFVEQTTVSLGSSRPLSLIAFDLNKDGHLDVAVVNNGTNSVGIVLGVGDGSFQNPVFIDTGYDSQPRSIAAADFDNDNSLDLVVANWGTNNIGFFYGYGNGAFESQRTYRTGYRSNPNAVAVKDLNKDGKMDIVIANSGSENIMIALGNENRTFLEAVSYSTGIGSMPYHVAFADVNSDNRDDIVVVDIKESNIYIFVGDGSGRFAKPISYSVGFGALPYYVATGYLNADKQSDIIVSNLGVHYLLLLTMYSNIPIAKVSTYKTENVTLPVRVAVGDFNNDKNTDIVVANWASKNINIFLGFGNGTFSASNTYLVGDDADIKSMATGDFNDDNQIDVVVTCGIANRLGIFLGNGDGTFQRQLNYTFPSGSYPYEVAVGDFNNDNHTDMAVVKILVNAIEIFLGYGNAAFQRYTVDLRYQVNVIQGLTVGDFNNDRRLDIVTVNYVSKSISILLGHGNGSFAAPITRPTAENSKPVDVRAGYLNHDNLLDIVVVYSQTSKLGVLLGNGNGTFNGEVTYSTGAGSNPKYIAISDCNNDGTLDIAVANFGTNTVGIFLGYGTGEFGIQIETFMEAGSNPYALAIDDFNNDRKSDIVVANNYASYIGILLMDYTAGFLFKQSYSTGSLNHPIFLTIADFNNDTYMDIGVTNPLQECMGIRLGYGNGTFAAEIQYSTGLRSRPQYLTTGDVNNDGILDIVITDPTLSMVYIFLSFGNGTFQSPSAVFTGFNSNPYLMKLGNFNSDNWIDMVVVNIITNNIAVFLGHHHLGFSPETTYSTGSRPQSYSVVVSDFNNDTIADIAVVNLLASNFGIFLGRGDGTFGAMTSFDTGHGSYPMSLVTGDFNYDGLVDIAVANSLIRTVAVYTGFGNGSFVKGFSYRFDELLSRPESIVVGDLDNDRLFDMVVADPGKNQVNVLVGYANGTFGEMTTYPVDSAIGPNLVALADVNSDNKLDIVALIDSSIGVLLGYGNRTFPKRFILSNADLNSLQSISIGDLNNDKIPDIVVTDSSLICLFIGYGNGSFTCKKSYASGDGSANIRTTVLADFNSDHQLDVAIPYSDDNYIAMFYGYGDGTFAPMIKQPTAPNFEPYSLAVGDFNVDGLNDIAVANYRGASVSIFLGRAIGYFYTATIYDTGVGSRPCSAAIADFNNDSFSDIAVSNNGTDSIAIFFGYGNGRFSNRTIYSTGSNSYPVALGVGDFNQDNKIDIVVVNSKNSNVGLFFGKGNGNFSNLSLYQIGTNTYPSAITVGHFNEDYYLDIALADSTDNKVYVLYGYGNGSFALNTTIHLGFGAKPTSIMHGRLNNDLWEDLAVSNFDQGTIAFILKGCAYI